MGIGYAVKRVPTVVESSEVLGQWAGAGLLAYFGLRTLQDAWRKTEEAADDELADAEEEGALRGRAACAGPVAEAAAAAVTAAAAAAATAAAVWPVHPQPD